MMFKGKFILLTLLGLCLLVGCGESYQPIAENDKSIEKILEILAIEQVLETENRGDIPNVFRTDSGELCFIIPNGLFYESTNNGFTMFKIYRNYNVLFYKSNILNYQVQGIKKLQNAGQFSYEATILAQVEYGVAVSENSSGAITLSFLTPHNWSQLSDQDKKLYIDDVVKLFPSKNFDFIHIINASHKYISRITNESFKLYFNSTNNLWCSEYAGERFRAISKLEESLYTKSKLNYELERNKLVRYGDMILPHEDLKNIENIEKGLIYFQEKWIDKDTETQTIFLDDKLTLLMQDKYNTTKLLQFAYYLKKAPKALSYTKALDLCKSSSVSILNRADVTIEDCLRICKMTTMMPSMGDLLPIAIEKIKQLLEDKFSQSKDSHEKLGNFKKTLDSCKEFVYIDEFSSKLDKQLEFLYEQRRIKLEQARLRTAQKVEKYNNNRKWLNTFAQKRIKTRLAIPPSKEIDEALMRAKECGDSYLEDRVEKIAYIYAVKSQDIKLVEKYKYSTDLVKKCAECNGLKKSKCRHCLGSGVCQKCHGLGVISVKSERYFVDKAQCPKECAECYKGLAPCSVCNETGVVFSLPEISIARDIKKLYQNIIDITAKSL